MHMNETNPIDESQLASQNYTNAKNEPDTSWKVATAKKVLKFAFWFTIGLALIGLSQYTARDKEIYDISVTIDGKEGFAVANLPYKDESGGKLYRYQFSYKGKDSGFWRIIADDRVLRIKINQTRVDLSHIPSSSLGDWKNGFKINFHEYLNQDKNEIEILTQNYGGPASLRIESLGMGAGGWITTLLLCLGFLLLCTPIVMRIELNSEKILFACAILLLSYYNSYVTYTQNAMDVLGHLEYIEYIIKNSVPPPPFGGWEFHQPPLYYLLAVPFYLLGDAFPWLNKYEVLQTLSNYLAVISLYFISKTFDIYFPNNRLPKLISFILICFWPSYVIHSSRIGNDPLYFLGSFIALYFTLLWWKNRNVKWAYWASLFAAIAVMSKPNGIVAVAVLGSLLLMYLFESGFKTLWLNRFKVGLYCFMIIFVGMIVSFGDNLYYQLIDGDHSALMGSSVLNSGLNVANEPRNYLLFDIQNFVTYPYALPWDDKGGRQFFWNFLLKTALWGEFSFQEVYRIAISVCLNGLFLIMIACVIRSAYGHRYSYTHAPLFLLVFFSLASVIVFRALSPASPHGDFRFVFPILVPFIIFYTYSMGERGIKSWRVKAKLAITAIFSAGSAAFFLTPMG